MGRFKVMAGENDTIIVGREVVTIPAGYYESLQSLVDEARERQRFMMLHPLGQPGHPEPVLAGTERKA